MKIELLGVLPKDILSHTFQLHYGLGQLCIILGTSDSLRQWHVLNSFSVHFGVVAEWKLVERNGHNGYQVLRLWKMAEQVLQGGLLVRDIVLWRKHDSCHKSGGRLQYCWGIFLRSFGHRLRSSISDFVS